MQFGMKFIMQVVTIFVIIGAFLQTAFGTEHVLTAAHPNNPGKCTIATKQRLVVLEPGKHQNPDECGQITCLTDGKAKLTYCPKYSVKEGCVRGNFVDKTKSFPECCNRFFRCSQSDGSIKTINTHFENRELSKEYVMDFQTAN